MPFPAVTDDGSTVSLDLHGATILEAERLLRACIKLAAERGRRSVRVIHGASTTDMDRHRPTVKSLVERVLADRSLEQHVNDYFFFEGHTLVAIAPEASRMNERITIRDIS